jgi:hypothetical protein
MIVRHLALETGWAIALVPIHGFKGHIDNYIAHSYIKLVCAFLHCLCKFPDAKLTIKTPKTLNGNMALKYLVQLVTFYGFFQYDSFLI